MQPVLHPIKNFCAAYGVGKTKAYELIASGQLESVKIGRKRLITDASARRALLGEAA
ncbi:MULTISPECIES: helix-turn-helix domain-containing protein [Sphingomonas]|jgi:excisionase family DNA binding protein|uniref:helix-turn-helix domain-containing protein n=1 Tax=Sphingomonas TaxID=13687 RepID=UPI000AB7E03F|nr:helix-turn-helix domain-containing protein [Sphingomonas yabuuchiae]